ncbi:DUF4058 family protein [Tautonia plasticadhaerens]|uniref:DUF4058 domain-containing protein n=1 Tax=Tautonia plasticadhaerens TaxID=2527974 RepID=A0A518GV99_9BACT|nr:DUF4058 family protein [Tautonia plasticadhaerens]QDV32515.1 hypothetical protein ElP_03480 [Tautonia plasticadhaerens]
MKSPFPGMDPYLEQFWTDVHVSLTAYTRDALQRRLPRDLRARVEERLYIEDPSGFDRRVAPDIAIIEEARRSTTAPVVAGQSGLAVAEPVLIHLHEMERHLRSIQVVDLRSGGRLVTSIEFLSLSNKLPGPGRELHLRTQDELKDRGVNLVEIDLLRDGERGLLSRPEHIPARARTTYQICSWRASRRDRYEVFRVPLRDRLPIIPIPLRDGDADVPLDLQELIDLAYENGRYGRIDYKAEAAPPLSREDAAWADGLLRGRGTRSLG